MRILSANVFALLAKHPRARRVAWKKACNTQTVLTPVMHRCWDVVVRMWIVWRSTKTIGQYSVTECDYRKQNMASQRTQRQCGGVQQRMPFDLLIVIVSRLVNKRTKVRLQLLLFVCARRERLQARRALVLSVIDPTVISPTRLGIAGKNDWQSQFRRHLSRSEFSRRPGFPRSHFACTVQL